VTTNPISKGAPEPGSRWGARSEADAIRPLAVRPPDAARILGVGERTLWEWTRQGRIRCLKAGGVKLYRVADLEAFLANLAEESGS
jgi:excisionase family DNA binding protein